jgi:hypothetical protein
MKRLINQPATRTEEQKPSQNMREIGFRRGVKEIPALLGRCVVRLVVC